MHFSWFKKTSECRKCSNIFKNGWLNRYVWAAQLHHLACRCTSLDSRKGLNVMSAQISLNMDGWIDMCGPRYFITWVLGFTPVCFRQGFNVVSVSAIMFWKIQSTWPGQAILSCATRWLILLETCHLLVNWITADTDKLLIWALETSEYNTFIREWFMRSFQYFHSIKGNHIFCCLWRWELTRSLKWPTVSRDSGSSWIRRISYVYHF